MVHSGARSANARRAIRRIPLLAVGMLTMACGMWLGLVRLGWNLPLPWPDQLIAHGPLMVCGFLGTLISLERAVALGARWGYAAPVLIAAGALLLDLGPVGSLGPLLITLGSIVMLAIFAVVWRRQPAVFIVAMALGALAWVVGNVLWLGGAAIFHVVFWWLAFLVLTIAGERLELNRVLRPTSFARATFVVATALILAGVAAAVRWPEPGIRMVGVGLIAMTGWLARNDVARRTVRQQGVTRFMAISLIGGYAWLGFGGGVAAATGVAMPGLVYDAMLHAVFLGFVMSMVFAHAPVILPAVLGIPLPYRPAFYLHIGVLHASLALRIVGDLSEGLGRWRVWGGLFNAVALVIFMVNTGRSIAMARPLAPAVRHAG
jgi:hypothetical protein